MTPDQEPNDLQQHKPSWCNSKHGIPVYRVQTPGQNRSGVPTVNDVTALVVGFLVALLLYGAVLALLVAVLT